MKKDHLVIHCTTAMLGDALEFLCIVLKNLDNGTKYGTQKPCYFKMQLHSSCTASQPTDNKNTTLHKELQCLSSKFLKPLFNNIYKAAWLGNHKMHIICSSLHLHRYSSPEILSQGRALSGESVFSDLLRLHQ